MQFCSILARGRVWRCQEGIQNQSIEEGQTTQWHRQTKKDKWTNNDLQSIHIKLKIEWHDPH